MPPESGTKAPHPQWLDMFEFAIVGTAAPLARPFEFHFEQSHVCCPRDVTPLKMTLIAETQMQGKAKRQVVSRISIEGLQLREPFLGLDDSDC